MPSNLTLPTLPATQMFPGSGVMDNRWQAFFRDLLTRTGGNYSYTNEELAEGVAGSLSADPDSMRVGSGSNYTAFDSNGTMSLHGDATVWDDLVGSLIGRRLYSTSGTLDYDYDENCIVMQPGGGISDSNDRLIFNYQYPHKAIEEGTLNLHMHWEQTAATDLEITVQYRIQSNNSAKETSWTSVVVSTDANNVFTYDSGTLNQITQLSEIDMTGAGISATVQFRVARTDSESGNINVTFVDAHYEIDALGSDQEYVK